MKNLNSRIKVKIENVENYSDDNLDKVFDFIFRKAIEKKGLTCETIVSNVDI